MPIGFIQIEKTENDALRVGERASPAKRLGLVVSLLLVFLIVADEVKAQAAEESGPNIVFFLVDDLGWRDLGCQGSTYYETPHIDRLAAEGLRFTQAYADAPNCAPSRACLMTGQWTPRHGIFTVASADRGSSEGRRLATPKNKTALDRSFVTLPEMLRARRYVSAAIGKWHLGAGPETQGFDVNVAGNRAGHPYGGYFVPYKNRNLPDGPRGEYLTDRLTDEAIAFVEARARDEKKRPFFLYLSHFGVHTPIQAPSSLLERFRRKPPSGGHDNPTYAAMIASVDESLGRLRKKLAELDLANNTVVVFFSDNGGHGPVTSMRPLRGAKGMLYEGGIRVPLIVHVPGVTPRGAATSRPVTGLDLVPTLLDLAGVPDEKRAPTDGESLRDLIADPARAATPRLDRALYWHFPAYLQATPDLDRPWRTTPASAIRAGDWKLVHYFEDDRRELYHLGEDPGETRDRAATEPERAARLFGRLEAWRRRTKAPLPPGQNPEWLDPELVAAARNRRPEARAKREPKTKPNLVIVLADDWSWSELGANGARPGVSFTPRIDALAAAGLRATAAYAGGAVGPSSRCSLLTGRQGGHLALRGRLDRGDRRALSLPFGEVTLAEDLRTAGYTTAWFGRWGLAEPRTPGQAPLQGFDAFIGSLEPRRRGRRAGVLPFRVGLDPVKAPATAEARDEVSFKGALDFLAARASTEPFLLVVAPEELRDRQGEGRADAVRRFDAMVGRLSDVLRERGLAEDTYLVVTSDQGAPGRLNPPFREGKNSLCEGGLKIPFVVHRPGVVPPRTSGRPLCLADLRATARAFAGLPAPPPAAGPAMRGIDLVAFFAGRDAAIPADRPLYWEHAQRAQALRRGRWKIYRPHPRGPVELYDLERDPIESRNLARTKTELVAELTALLERCRVPSALFPLVR